MYNKAIFFIVCGILLGCAHESKLQESKIVAYYPQEVSKGQFYATKEQELSKNPDILEALQLYVELFGHDVQWSNWRGTTYTTVNLSEDLETHLFNGSHLIEDIRISDLGYFKYSQMDIYPQFMVFQHPESKPYCFINSNDNSDECILARRKEPNSQIHYFNYRKYMPKSIKLTDDGFLNLANLYVGTRAVIQKCYSDTLLTSSEREECAKEVDEFLINIANGKVDSCKHKVNKQYNKEFVDGAIVISTGFGPFNQQEKDEICKAEKVRDRASNAAQLSSSNVLNILYFEWENKCVIEQSVLINDRTQRALKREMEWCAKPYMPPPQIGIPVRIVDF